MKIKLLCLLCVLVLPSMANAEIYKWKDKDGSVRYSDIPPPANVKQEPIIGRKIAKPTGQAPLATVEGDGTAELNKAKDSAAKDATNKANEKEKAPLSKDEAAAKRAKDADAQKKADEAKQAELKQKQENCKISKSNLNTFTEGGRITRMNDKGEREYLGDADIAKEKEKAQQDVKKYCD